MASNDSMAVVPKKRSHLFQKGQSGNPAGRPKGSRNAITLVKLQVEGELREQMRGELQAILKSAISAALNGDTDMQKWILNKWVSGTKVADDSDAPKEKIQIVIGALENGKAPPIEGHVIKSDQFSEGK